MKLRNCNIETFFARCAGKKVACYGIGSIFYNFVNNYPQYPWSKEIEFLVDSNPEKTGEQILLWNRNYCILNRDALLSEDASNLVIFVTCGFFTELVEQLNEIPKLDQTECYIYDFMLGWEQSGEISIRQKEKAMIPPVIHYCWFGGNEMQDLHKRCLESWHKFCPDYKIVEWNEGNCDISENLYAKQAYEKKKYGFVPDYFRLKIIYEHGGIYLDTDVELVNSLDDLRWNEAYCGMERPGVAALGLGFGAMANHPAIWKMLERYQTMRFVRDDGTLDETASPIWQTMDLMNMGMRYGNCLQKAAGMTIYPVEVLSPKNVGTRELNLTEYSYSIHHFDGAWIFGENSSKKKKLYDALQKIRSMFME